VSRKTAYEYIERYAQQGVEGLTDFVRAPHSHPDQTSVLVERMTSAAPALLELGRK